MNEENKENAEITGNTDSGLYSLMEVIASDTVAASLTVLSLEERCKYPEAIRLFIAAYYVLHGEIERGLITAGDVGDIVRKAMENRFFRNLDDSFSGIVDYSYFVPKAELSANIFIILSQLYEMGTESEAIRLIIGNKMAILETVMASHEYIEKELVLNGRLPAGVASYPKFKEAAARYHGFREAVSEFEASTR